MPKISAELFDNYEVKVHARQHILTSGEPIDEGGNDAGAAPKELLLSSLAGCKLITMKMYAERKGWDVDALSISLEIIESEGEKTQIRKQIQFPASMDAQHKERLHIISGRCPISKMLQNSIAFVE